MRQFDVSEPFLLILGFWEQTAPEEKTWVNAQAVRIEPEDWRRLWGRVTRADLEKLDAVVKNKGLSLEEARRRAQKMKSAPPFDSAIIQLNPKVDRAQRRLQCSLSFSDFFNHLAPSAARGRQEHPEILGVALPRKIPSAPRSFGR